LLHEQHGKFWPDEQWYHANEDFFTIDGLELRSDADELDQDIHTLMKAL
jgi:hypothetical protein